MPDTVRQGSMRLLLPLSTGVVMFLISSMERDPAVAAEAAYLSGLAVAVLLATAFAAPAVNLALGLQCLLSAAAIWALPGTPDRAAALSVVLVVGGAIAIVGDRSASNRRLGPSRLMALILGVQLVFRSAELLNPEPLEIATLLGWGALAGVSAHLLSETVGARAAALATATSVLVGGGFHAINSLGLAALSGGRLLFDSSRSRSWRVAGGVLLLSPLLLGDERALVCIAAGLLFSPLRLLHLLGPLVLIGFGLLRSESLAEDLRAALPLLVLFPIVLPQLLFDLRRGGSFQAGALLLGLAALTLQPHTAALATPLSVAALCLGTRTRSASSQQLWTTTLLLGSLLCAAPPWYRGAPLPEALALAGLDLSGWSALAVLIAFAVVWLATRRESTVTAPALTGGFIALALLLAAPTDSALLIHRQPIVLTDTQPTWSLALDSPRPARKIVVDTTFANSTSTAPGAVLARLRVETAEGVLLKAIRIGEESGEWAALRDDIAAIPGFTAPPPHLKWVDASGTHFGQRYRTVWVIDSTSEITEVEVSLEPGAPPGLVLTVFYLELRG